MQPPTYRKDVSIGQLHADSVIHHTTDTTSKLAWYMENYRRDIENIKYALQFQHVDAHKRLLSVAIYNANFWRILAMQEANN